MSERKNPLEFIKTLRQTADLLEANEIAYHWDNAIMCNCGVIACQIVGVAAISGRTCGTWQGMSSRYQDNLICSVTGSPLDEVFDTLLSKGFLIEDFKKLENLSDPEVLAEAGFFRPISYANKSNLIGYLRAWANVICKQQCKLNEQTNGNQS